VDAAQGQDVFGTRSAPEHARLLAPGADDCFATRLNNNRPGWRMVFELAQAYGRNPAGTEPPAGPPEGVEVVRMDLAGAQVICAMMIAAALAMTAKRNTSLG
jgi:hypothetical protein